MTDTNSFKEAPITPEPSSTNIKDLIFTVRGVQVLLDSDVAMLYGYEKRAINQAATRNIERFPETFRFKLTQSEYEEVNGMIKKQQRFTLGHAFENERDALKSHFVISNVTKPLGRGGSRKLPYAYSEQGIAMLSGLLKSETAVQVSIGIMNAFVDMRRLIAAFGGSNDRLTRVEHKILVLDERVEEIFRNFLPAEIPKQRIFFKGEMFDAYSLIIDIITTAKRSITIIDTYVDDSILRMLARKAEGVRALIISGKPQSIDELAIRKFNEQYPSLELIKSRDFHDRFIIIDNATTYHLGASIKDAGKQCFAIAVIDDPRLLVSELKRFETTC